MSFLNPPTQTANIHGADDSKLGQLITITAAAKEPKKSSVALGTDTCGFAVDIAITCDSGYVCANVDSYRGCCVSGAEDCSATLHTRCLNYEDMSNAAMCGPHTLCCSPSKAHCLTYEFVTEQPDVTFTHVRCARTPDPPEFRLSIEDLGVGGMPSTLIVEPVASTDSSSSSSPPPGAIAGAVAGGVVLIFLVLLGIVLLFRRQRQRRQKHTPNRAAAYNTLEPLAVAMVVRNKASSGPLPAPSTAVHGQQQQQQQLQQQLQQLQQLQQQLLQLQPPPSRSGRRSSVSSALRTYGVTQNWVLGLGGRTSPKNPLSSHPAADLARRAGPSPLDDTDLLPPPRPRSKDSREEEGEIDGTETPQTWTPTPPPHVTRLAPPPPKNQKNKYKNKNKNKRAGPSWTWTGTTVTPTTTTTAATGIDGDPGPIRSPRLTCIPPPAIDAAFGEEVERTLDAVSGPADDDGGGGGLGPAGSALSSSPPPSRDGGGRRRLSFVSALGVSRDEPPPVASLGPPDGGADGRASPLTVSPLQSRRGSFGV